MKWLALITTLACAAGTGAALAHKAHVHGLARLDVAVEAGNVTLSAEIPMDSLVGFERAPRTDAERKAATEALATLRDGARLFRFDAAAQCTLKSAEVDAPVIEQPAKAAPAGGHADVDARYSYACAQPAQLAALEVLLFDAFKRIERIEVQAALAKGQTKSVLRRSARQVKLVK